MSIQKEMAKYKMRKHKINILYQIDYDNFDEYQRAIERYEIRGWVIIYTTNGYGNFSAFTIVRKEGE
jgi:hypothetical protein